MHLSTTITTTTTITVAPTKDWRLTSKPLFRQSSPPSITHTPPSFSPPRLISSSLPPDTTLRNSCEIFSEYL